MDTKYIEQRNRYFKVLGLLLLLTALTFVQPHMFLSDYTLATQLFIGVVKAWLILMYYMHLKGEKQIITFGYFALFVIAVFFIIVIGFDVTNFQFQDVSYITSDKH